MVLNVGKKRKKMKLVKMKPINKVIFLILSVLVYTYVVIFLTTTHMLKVVSTNDIVSYTTMQMVMENNKSIESFLNFQIKSSIDLAEQEYSIFSNPMDLYHILYMFSDKKRLCHTIIKDSNNTDIKEFMENNCGEK
jgi:CHASE1-domain containing sensor protein